MAKTAGQVSPPFVEAVRTAAPTGRRINLPGGLATLLAGATGHPHACAPEAVPATAGAYVLAIALPVRVSLRVRGRLVTVPTGAYVYCGSARGPGGLQARLGRHLRSDKAASWHIDRLTVRADRMEPWPVVGGSECALVTALLATGAFEAPVPGFGSSDCRSCPSHLLRYRAG